MPPPSSSYTDNPSRQICVNEDWLSFVIGRLWAMEHESYWSDDGYNAAQQITNLIDEWVNRSCVMVAVGSIMLWPGLSDDLPENWLYCAGQTLQPENWPDLFAIIGYMYGGDAQTGFLLPDLRARSPMGSNPLVGGNPNLSVRGLASTGGAENHTLTESEMPAHTHTYTRYSELNSTAQMGSPTLSSLHRLTSSQNTGSKGGGQSHNNVHPFLVVDFIIYSGLYVP
jgi:microcystin-dependent protein